MSQILTAGYSGHKVAQLKRAADELGALVLDIRMSPRSRMPEWNRDAVAAALGNAYQWFPDWGNVNYGGRGDIELKNAPGGAIKVLRLAALQPLILLCGCKNFGECHRAACSAILRCYGIQTQEIVWPELAVAGSLPGLSIRQPWAWLVANGWKDIENRDWETNRRGRFLIHASKSMTKIKYENARAYAAARGAKVPPMEQLERGGIVGEASIVDCVDWHESKWFVGDFGFVIRDAKPSPFVPFNGALKFFDVPLSVLEGEKR